jgi:septal ring factor EnvC (AmiA/AmiB activator)
MKTKSWVLWLLVAAFLASVGFLFLANRQKVAALDSARESKQQVEDLQTQLDQLKSSIAAERNAELSKLRADNLDLPRLRNQVTQLQAANMKFQAANQKLTQQLQAILSTAQQQQGQLQQLVTEKQQTRAAAAQADEEAARNACINNLRQIDAAKNEWALENNKAVGAVPTEQELVQYLKNYVLPTCPSGGTYTINAVGTPPTCSIPGHVLPDELP